MNVIDAEHAKPSLKQVKREAKILKRERGISHCLALEIVAEKYGFLDWHEAQTALDNDEVRTP